MESIKVSDYMVQHPVVLKPDMPLATAVDLLLERGQMGAPVVDGEGMLKGFASEKDCLGLMLKSSYHCDLTATVADVMRTDVLTVQQEDSVVSVAELMMGAKPKIYPVIESGKVVGIIDRSRVLKAIANQLKVCFRHAV